MAGMTLERFESLIDLHGSDLELWPAKEREPAHRLLRESVAASDLLAGARAVTEALDTFEAPKASVQLKSAILADAHQTLSALPVSEPTMSPRASSPLSSLWQGVRSVFAEAFSPWAPQVAAAMLVALFGGVAAGAFVTNPSVDQETLVAAYGADIDYWMNEFDPDYVDANGSET